MAGDGGIFRESKFSVENFARVRSSQPSLTDWVPAPLFDSSRRASQALLISTPKMTRSFFAGDGGIEPPTVLLESAVMPLN